MTPFQEFRLWARRAPTGDRVLAAIAGATVLALLVWVAVPGGGSDSAVNVATAARPGAGSPDAAADTSGGTTATGNGGIATGAPADTGGSATATANGSIGPRASTGGSGSAGTSGSAGGPPAGSSGTGASTSGGKCASPPGSDQGVSATAIKIAVVLTNVAGPTGNAALGVPSPADQQNNFLWVIDSINAAGGVACRKLVPQFFNGNPVDESQLQQTCLDIAEAGVFAVIDLAAYGLHPAAQGCFPQHQLPFLTSAHGANTQVAHDYPYLFPAQSINDGNHNTVFALAARGFFSPANGFNKLGFVYTSCFPEMSGEIIGWLHQVGLSSSQIVTYDFGCPSGFASPADVQQAILRFQQAGVTHVTINYLNVSFKIFTDIAQQQGFRPKYGIPAQSIIALSDGETHPNYANIANAIAIAGDRQAERHTPGYAPSAGTQRCNAIFAAHGRPPAYQAQDVGASGWACASIWELTAMIDHAPAMRRNALAAGLQATGSIDMPFPLGPNDFRGTKVTVGNQFWRPAQFFTSCNCWQVIDPKWKARFR